MDNERDAHGTPLCPVCSQLLPMRAPVIRVRAYMIHLQCARETPQRLADDTLSVVSGVGSAP
jgi:hypothetical protein